jgi:DNA repair exonuclease SbcCD ATPase subunit
MEALAGVASGRAVTSLTIQLVDSISKIKTFVDNVKDAPKELKRLVEKLQLLSALLEEVRKILEAQASGQEQHFPPASTVLSQGLQRCEKSIQLLKDIVGRFRMPQSQLGSTVAKLKSEVKLGFKVKEIATVETRIQQDIDYLHMCLTMNSTVIL